MTKDEKTFPVTKEFHEGVEKVYFTVTCGRFSKLNTHSSNIIAVFEEKFIEKETALIDIIEMLENSTFKQFEKKLKKYLS